MDQAGLTLAGLLPLPPQYYVCVTTAVIQRSGVHLIVLVVCPSWDLRMEPRALCMLSEVLYQWTVLMYSPCNPGWPSIHSHWKFIIYVYVYIWVHTCAIACLWSQDSVDIIPHHMCSGDQNHITRLGNKCPYPLGYLTGSWTWFVAQDGLNLIHP